MELAAAEAQLGVLLPVRHRQAMLDPADPIHEAYDFLVLASPFELLRWVEVNESLHAPNQWNSWPRFVVAFASNGCGDYFDYDTRTEPYRVYYIGPEFTVSQAIATCEAEGFVFSNFDDWYSYAVSRDA